MSTPENQGDTTALLRRINQNDEQARNELYDRFEERLRSMAHAFLATKLPQQDLESMMMVDDTFLKLMTDASVTWTDSSHFLGFAKVKMKQLFIDNLRATKAKRRDPGTPQVHDPECLAAIPARHAAGPEDLLTLEEAMRQLEKRHPLSFQVVQMRLDMHTFEEIGEKLKLGLSGAYRRWERACDWLRRELAEEGPS